MLTLWDALKLDSKQKRYISNGYIMDLLLGLKICRRGGGGGSLAASQVLRPY